MVIDGKRSEILSKLERVKFITSKDNSHKHEGYRFRTSVEFTFEDFKKAIDEWIGNFEHLGIKSDTWDQIKRCLELYNLEYDQHALVDHWKSTPHQNFMEHFESLSSGNKGLIIPTLLKKVGKYCFSAVYLSFCPSITLFSSPDPKLLLPLGVRRRRASVVCC